MKKERSRNRRLIISKNLILMLVLISVGLMAVWSWFTVNQKVEANTIKVTAAYPNEVSFAKVLKYYGSDGKLENEGPDVFKGEIDFNSSYLLTKDCTGDGETLLVPDFSVIKDRDTAIRTGRQVNNNGIWEEALSQADVELIKNKNQDAEVEARYMEFEFYVRSKTKEVNLMPGCYLRGESEASSANALSVAPGADKKSNYGNFNVDALVGSVRVAFLAQGVTNVTQNIENGVIVEPASGYGTTANLEAKYNNNTETMTKELTGIWVPRPDVYLNVSDNITQWTLITGVLPGTSLGTNGADTGSTYQHRFYEPVTTSATPKTYEAKVVRYRGANTPLPAVDTDDIEKKTGTGVKENTVGDKVFCSTDVAANDYARLGTQHLISDLSYGNYLQQSTLRRVATLPFDGTNREDYFVYKYTIRIWIEGTDTEARRAMDGGTFSLLLEVR